MAPQKRGRSLACRLFPPTRPAKSAAARSCKSYPALPKSDLEAFGDGVARIQEIVGDHFAPAQGGGRFTSEPVSRVAARLKALGAHGIGQSSWGPTGFAFASDPDHAEFLARRARAECGPGMQIKICNARHHGAEIREEEDVSVR